MNEKIDRLPMPDCRFYGIFAVNKDDPTDILGYVENSFSMGWSKYYVNLHSGRRSWYVERATRRWLEDIHYPKSDEEFVDWARKCANDIYDDSLTVDEMRKKYHDKIYKMMADTHLALSVKNRLNSGCWVPENYEVKMFRLNSKRCPVEVDLRYRFAYNHGWTKVFDKWKYRNALFFVKDRGTNKGKTFIDFFPTCSQSFKQPVKVCDTKNWNMKFFIKDGQPYKTRKKLSNGKKAKDIVKGLYSLTRSEWKILKKQRKNSFAAKERSPESGLSIA